MYAYEESLKFEPKMLLKAEVAAEIAELSQQRLELGGYRWTLAIPSFCMLTEVCVCVLRQSENWGICYVCEAWDKI